MSKKFGLGIVLAAAMLLAACGGGGGGGGGTVKPPTITGSVTSVTDAKIALGASSGESTIAWTSNATAADQISVRVNGVKVSGQPASPAGGEKVQAKAGDVKVELVDGAGKELDTKTAKASCEMGHWQNGTCAKYVFGRLDVVILQLTPEQFWVLRDGKAIPFVNKTGYDPKPKVAEIPLGNCVLWSVLREDGAPLVSCATIETGNQRRTFPLDPLTLEILPEYTGALPAGSEMIDAGWGGFGNTPYMEYGISYPSQYVEVPGYGIYYVDDDTTRIRLTRDMFKTYTVVKENEGFRLMYTFFGPQ